MMIALVILGFGLLVIGAALPVGLKYERDTIDRTTGQAAAEYALDLIEQNVRLTRDPYWDSFETPPGPGVVRHYADVFQPRNDQSALLPAKPGELATEPSTSVFPGRLWEPRIKVRPLLTVNIDPADLTKEPSPADNDTPYAAVANQIQLWFTTYAGTPDRTYLERDANPPNNWAAPTLPSVAAVYPPVPFALPFRTGTGTGGQPGDFFGHEYDRVWATPAQAAPTQATRRKILDRQVSWVGFYRRVSYAEGSDPNLYEVIAVATRRPQGYFFPWYRADTGQLEKSPAPVPWLMVFTGMDQPPAIGWLSINKPAPYPPDRVLDPNFHEPPALVFVCSADDGQLLPAGSILIPAVNDNLPSASPTGISPRVQWAGFVPHSPDTLPIYDVIKNERRDDGQWNITVRNNGFYPWAQGGNLGLWPVWVIPPAFKETQTDSTGRQAPVCDAKSPILAVSRRVIRFSEVP
jgi:hypothetical protein